MSDKQDQDFLKQLEADIERFAGEFSVTAAMPEQRKRFDVSQMEGLVGSMAQTQQTSERAATRPASPLLASLRAQASERLRESASQAAADSKRRSEMEGLVNAVMAYILRYLNDLTAQLNVVQPEYPGFFVIAPPHCLDNLRWKAGHASCRMTSVTTETPLYEHVLLGFKRETVHAPTLVKDYPLCHRFREILLERGVGHEVREIRNEFGYTIGMEFDIAGEIPGSLFFKPDYETGRISLVSRNLQEFELKRYDAEARDIGADAMDMVAKHLLGEVRELTAPFIRLRDNRSAPPAASRA